MSEPLYLDISEKEASSESRKPFPSGRYHIAITDVELREVKQGDNKGKPLYAIEFTVQSGDYQGRTVWTNACLWPGATYTIVQILKAMGHEVSTKLRVPPAEELLDAEFEARITIKKSEEYGDKNEIKAFWPYGEGTTKTSKDDSLLPS